MTCLYSDVNNREVRPVLSGQHNNIWTTHTDIAAAAERGDPKAQFTLGWYYYIGHGVTQDKSIAAEWYEKAARKGHPEAKRLLELVHTKPSEPAIADLIVKGHSVILKRTLVQKALFLIFTLTVVFMGIFIYSHWPEDRQSVVESKGEDVFIPKQRMQIENEPNRSSEKTVLPTQDIQTVYPGNIVAVPNEPSLGIKPIASITTKIEKKTIVDSNSIEEDPNSLQNQRDKKLSEQFMKIAHEWLREAYEEKD